MNSLSGHKILIIEDDQPLAESIQNTLEQFSNYRFDIQISNSGIQGLTLIKSWQPEVITLDLALPDLHGLNILSYARNNLLQPKILVISASCQNDDILYGLENGADDYLGKPFSQKELYIRVKNLLRRGRLIEDARIIFDDIYLNTNSRSVTRFGNIYNLTQKEYLLLLYLMQNAGQVISRKQLLSEVWKDKDCFPNLVDVYLDRLRKIIDKPFGSKYLKTAYGHGYYFDPEGKNSKI